MTDEPLTADQLYLQSMSSKDIVAELMQRGVLRSYGIDNYVPSIVRRRHQQAHDMTDEQFARIVLATSLNKLTEHMLREELIAFGSRPPSDPDAPPGDLVYSASVLTLDPSVEL